MTLLTIYHQIYNSSKINYYQEVILFNTMNLHKTFRQFYVAQMSDEVFYLIGNEKYDTSFKKKEIFVKIYHQHGAQINDESQSINFFSGENLNCIQVGNGISDKN